MRIYILYYILYLFIYIYIYIRPVVLTVGGRSRLGGPVNLDEVFLLDVTLEIDLLDGRGRHSVVATRGDVCSRSCRGGRPAGCSRSCILHVFDSLRGLDVRHPHHHGVHADPSEARISTGRRPALLRRLRTSTSWPRAKHVLRHLSTQARRHAGTHARRHAGTLARRHAGTHACTRRRTRTRKHMRACMRLTYIDIHTYAMYV